MSAPTTHRQDSSLSAASFLASISAECSTSFGSTSNSAASFAPSLPISAKVSLIDAQIDALGGRIEEAVTSHADELRQRAASTRSVDHDLNQLWRSINQTSSRLVTVGPQLAPIASEYHDALAQSSKQGLLISVLSDLLAATKHLERLEKLQHQNDLTTLRAELTKAAELLQPFRSRSALQSMPAVVELTARFDRLKSRCKQVDVEARSRSTEAIAPRVPPAAQARASLQEGRSDHKETSSTTNATAPALSPALKVLEPARALIMARGSEGGWKEVRTELDAPAPPPPTIVPAAEPPAQPTVNSNRSSLDVRAERILREDSAPGSTSLTRNSSSSSATNARNRHKPKLGARVIRPQDQLGSGPFNAEEAALEEDGWGLDEDEDEATQPTSAATPSHVNQPVHPTVASLARASHNSSPSGSVAMQGSMSSSSSQRSAFAVQEPESSAGAAGSGNDVDAWGLGDEEDEREADGWGLENAGVHQQRPPSPKRTKRASVLIRHAPAPTIASATTDAWDLDEEDDQEQLPASPQKEVGHVQAPVEPVTAPATTNIAALADDAWDLEEDTIPEQVQASLNQEEAPVQAPIQPEAAPTMSTLPTTIQDARDLEGEAIPEPVSSSPKKAKAPVQAPVTQREAPVAVSTAFSEDARNLEDDDVRQQPPQQPVPTQPKEDEAHADIAVEDPSVQASQRAEADQDGWGLEEMADPVVDDDPWTAEDQFAESAPALQAVTPDPPPVLASTADPSHADAAASARAVQAEPSYQPEAPAQVLTSAEKASQHVLEATTASHGSYDKTAAHQPAATLGEQKEEEEPAEDAWAFEEGSSASEADKAEFAPMASIDKTAVPTPPATQPARDTASKVQSPTAPVVAATTARSIPTEAAVPASEKPEPVASPPSSPGGWGEDFSDSESTGVPASASQHNIAASRSLQSESKAPAKIPAKATHAPATATEPPAVVKEKCTISQRSLDLIDLAETTMSSVVSLLHTSSQSVDEAESLGGTIFKIFELHRALMPVAHGEVLRDVPSLAMQFFNDCEYLARELTRLVSDKGDSILSAWLAHDADAARRWKTKEVPKLEQEAALTRALGQRWFEAQMTAQSKILLDTLMEADGFARTFDDNRFARCERCIKQVVQTLQQLDKAWRRVLVASRFHAAIGRLVDLVFQKVLHDVLDLEDIGESESEKLASLVKTLGSLEGVFTTSDGQSAAPLWVPSWFKTSYLIEILTGSLVDIEFLAFEAGALVDYSRKELTGLIKALFADTPNRSKLLRRIEGAGVDVLAH
ncbi:hypothetical protein NDA16_002360 [Ustilago loliicola]|nr:hypothetical protein NDA16_002360 [Ustilago loliicola]